MKILITGSKGQLGIEIAKQLRENKKIELILTDVKELDISNIKLLMRFMRDQKPSMIINCAAYNAVDDCENNIDTAYRINAIGSRNLAIASLELGAKIVHFSTDYVFEGNGVFDSKGCLRPYNEFDKANPKTAYGASKLEGERFIQSINPKHFIVRTSGLYGEGKNFVRAMLALSNQKEIIKVVDDQHVSPTSVMEVAKLVKVLLNSDNYGLFHGTCEGQCTWYEFTKKIFSLKEIKVQVMPITTEELERTAKRPKYSVLDNYMLRLTSGYTFSHWEEEIKIYLGIQ